MLGVALVLDVAVHTSCWFCSSRSPDGGFVLGVLGCSALDCHLCLVRVVSGANQPLAHWAASAVTAIVIGGIVLSFFASLSVTGRTLLQNVFGMVILFVPSLSALAHPQKYPPEAQKVWSTVLQEHTWQGMNTGSEYAATRQRLSFFAGDRVSEQFLIQVQLGMKESIPCPSYRLLSLESKTGTKKNEMEYTGRWGAMPFIYATNDDHIDMQSDPPRVLNADLSSLYESVSGSISIG